MKCEGIVAESQGIYGMKVQSQPAIYTFILHTFIPSYCTLTSGPVSPNIDPLFTNVEKAIILGFSYQKHLST